MPSNGYLHFSVSQPIQIDSDDSDNSEYRKHRHKHKDRDRERERDTDRSRDRSRDRHKHKKKKVQLGSFHIWWNFEEQICYTCTCTKARFLHVLTLYLYPTALCFGKSSRLLLDFVTFPWYNYTKVVTTKYFIFIYWFLQNTNVLLFCPFSVKT